MMRLAVTGPESTGKSTLAEQLALSFDCNWIPEYAREYIGSLCRPYSFEDVENIALTQLKYEDQKLCQGGKILIVDTELLVIKIWMEHKFEKTPHWLEDEIVRRKYDLYLLCNIDVPWVDDRQREHPHLREYFFQQYVKELEDRHFNYKIISGDQQQRLNVSVDLIRSYMS